MSATITIQNASEIKNVLGEPRNANSKPVVCIDTGEIFTSVQDAAANADAHPSTMSWCLTGRQKTCKGKRYCYLSQLNEYLDEFLGNVRIKFEKADKYDELLEQKTNKEPVKVAEKPAVVYNTPVVRPEVRKAKHNPLQKAREMINRGSNIISLFKAI